MKDKRVPDSSARPPQGDNALSQLHENRPGDNEEAKKQRRSMAVVGGGDVSVHHITSMDTILMSLAYCHPAEGARGSGALLRAGARTHSFGAKCNAIAP